MKVSEFQQLIKDLYFHQDFDRGIEKSFLWLVEEIGELASNVKSKMINKKEIGDEMADIVAWICSLANLFEIELEEALFRKYPNKCIKCDSNPCRCNHSKL